MTSVLYFYFFFKLEYIRELNRGSKSFKIQLWHGTPTMILFYFTMNFKF